MMSGGDAGEKLQRLIQDERDAHDKIRNLRNSLERDKQRIDQRYLPEIQRNEQKIISLGNEIRQLEREIARKK